MSESVLRDKSKDFAKQVVFLCREMKKRRVESPLVYQFLRCGTSVGANVHEAQYAQGAKDFISKLEIALKECNETDYWIEVLFNTGCVSSDEFNKIKKQIIELRRMLVSSVRTMKEKL